MQRRKIRTNSLSYHLLNFLESAIENSIYFADFLDNPGKFAFTGYRTSPNSSSLYRSVNTLKEKGYLETQKDEGKLILKLTDIGKQQAIMAKLLENKAWDGSWRIVIFDIPETHRKLRHVLRSKLREWQFSPLQKSVWISKKDVAVQMREYTAQIGISDWVKIFVAGQSN